LNDLLHVGWVYYSVEAAFFWWRRNCSSNQFLRYGASENHSGIRNNLLEREVKILGK